MLSDPSTLRIVTPEDAERLAHMHLAAWHETFTGTLAFPLAEDLSMSDRIARWKALLQTRDLSGAQRFYWVEQRGEVLGFIGCGSQSSSGLVAQGFGGEIGSFYVLGRAQRQGVGGRLWTAANEYLASQGFTGASLWVLRDNQKARAFFDRHGGRVIGEQHAEQKCREFQAVAYAWTLAQWPSKPAE